VKPPPGPLGGRVDKAKAAAAAQKKKEAEAANAAEKAADTVKKIAATSAAAKVAKQAREWVVAGDRLKRLASDAWNCCSVAKADAAAKKERDMRKKKGGEAAYLAAKTLRKTAQDAANKAEGELSAWVVIDQARKEESGRKATRAAGMELVDPREEIDTRGLPLDPLPAFSFLMHSGAQPL
jgi:hypothetical protein